MKKALALSCLFLVLFAGIALPQTETTIYYQKTLTGTITTSANPVSVAVTFSIWDAQTGGNQLWQETKNITASKKTKAITTNLGDTNPLTEADFGPHMWVQVQAGGKVNGGRDVLEGSPYALSMENVIMDEFGDTAVGIGAFSTSYAGNLQTDANDNTAIGYTALASITNGGWNTAIGAESLLSNTTGNDNTAVGMTALRSNSTGSANIAVGLSALYSNATGGTNTAVGNFALWTSTGNGNTALGYFAGNLLNTTFTGSNNIYIGANAVPATASESNTARIGHGQTQTFIAGITGVPVTSATPVYVNGAGQLGIISSSRRYKEDISDMGDASSGLLKLRPVSFHYKPEYAEGPRQLQYGLIAEEVAEVYPNLVQYDPKTGQPQTVYYHLINAMLLNEAQKQQHRIAEQDKELSALKEEVSALKQHNEELSALKEQVKKLMAMMEQNRESSPHLSKLEARLDK